MPSARGWERIWFCCYCGDGPWSFLIDNCQNSFHCKHYHSLPRCDACRVEVHRTPPTELWGRSERGSNTSSGDAALQHDGSLEPHLQQTNIPEETNLHAAFPELADPHGSDEPSPPVSWFTEPQLPFDDYPTSGRLIDLEPLPPGLPNTSCQATTTFAWGYSDPYPTTLKIPDDQNPQSVWQADPRSSPSEPWLSTLDQPHSNSFGAIGSAGQSQPTTHHGNSQHDINCTCSLSIPTNDRQTLDNGRDGRSGHSGLLACPFWKKDPHRAWLASQACCTGHKRIRDVKQHIYRHHIQPAPNKTQSLKSKRKAKIETVERVPEQQVLQLKGKYSKRNSGERAQWFAIWDILFPNLKLSRPASPYVKCLESELDDFRMFCLGRDIEIEISGLTAPTDPEFGTTPLSPISSLPMVHDSSATAVWATEGLYTGDDASFRNSGGFGFRYNYR